MTGSGSFDDRVTRWLRTGPDRAPADLLGDVVAGTATVPQRRGVRRAAAARWPLAAAAAVIVATVTWATLPALTRTAGPGASQGVGPPVSPSPSARLGAGVLAPGSYALTAAGGDGVPDLLVAVPAGWRSLCDALPCFALVSGVGPGRLGLAYWQVEGVYPEPCRPIGAPSLGPSPADLAEALRTVEGVSGTQPVATTFGGHDAVTMDLVTDSEIPCEPNSFHIWSAAGNIRRYLESAGQTIRLWILTIDGERVVVQVDWSPGTTEARLAELFAVAASARFDQ